jgi:hypothetical protein
VKVSFELFPFLVLSILGFLCCSAVPRLKKYASGILMGPPAFGFCSLIGLWLGLFVWSRTTPLLHLSGYVSDRLLLALLGGGFLLCGIGGTWLTLRLGRRALRARTIAIVFSVVVVILAVAGTSVLTCIRRGHVLQVKEEVLHREALAKLRVGAGNEEVTRFFDVHGMKVQFAFGEASGTVLTTGCAPFVGCGDDSALIGLRVRVDSAGTVTSQPVVVAMYTNCL